MNRLFSVLATIVLLLFARTASAHISYSNRNLGTFNVVGTLVTGTNNNGTLTNSGTSATVTITNQNVAGEFGWAAGTGARFADTHKLRAFRFTLQTPAIVTLSVTGLSYVSGQITFTPLDHPGFSLYQGLAHLPPNALDHDQSAISQAWLDALVGTGNHDGAFNALGDWRIGSDNPLTPADLSSFIYVGNAADGTSANYGSASGINGDGNANGSVTATFFLATGDYSLFVGGGNYSGTSNSSLGIQTMITVVPEPSVLGLMGLAALGGLFHLGRKRPLDREKTDSSRLFRPSQHCEHPILLRR